MRIDYSQLGEAQDGRLLDGEGNLFTGTYFETNGLSGRLLTEGDCVDGLEHGFVREWFPSGNLESEEQKWRGLAHGECRSWYENGRLKFWCRCEGGFTLEWKRWDEEGNLVQHATISDDNRRLLDSARQKLNWPPSPSPAESSDEKYTDNSGA